MKRKSLLVVLLVALFVPLAMNAQTKPLRKSAKGLPKLEVKAPAKAMPSNPMLSKLESAKEAALQELENNNTRALGDYELVTASQSNWSGTYVLAYIASTTQARVMTGRGGSSTNTYGTGTLITMTNNTLSASNVSNYAMTIAADGNYYTIKFGNYYLGAKNGNYLLFSTTTPTSDAYRWTIAYSNNTLTITNASYTTRQIKWNSQTNGQRFACYTSGQNAISLFKLNDGCSAPENFAASNVTTNSVTLSWTETGTSEEWAILYMSEEDTEAQVEYVDTNPYTLTGLNPNTYYIAEVIPMCGDYDQESNVIEFTTEDLPCPQPTNLTVSDVTMSSATLSWSGEADSYTIQYRVPSGFRYDFESAAAFAVDDFSPCTTYDGDGYATYTIQDVTFDNQGYTGSFINFQSGIASGLSAHGGNSFGACFAATTPSNNDWFILPAITINNGDVFSFWAKEYTDSYPEAFKVGVYRGNGAFSSYLAGSASSSITPTTTWTEYSYDLSAYAGQTIQLAIQCVSNDAFIFCIDDIFVGNPSSDSWDVTLTDVTSPYTITGLQPETTYEWHVQGDCGADGQSLWSATNTFTTESACGAPVGLTATNITNSSASLSWTGNTDAYNLHYRPKGFVYDFESAEAWAVDNFAPCTTYDGDQTQCYGLQDAEVTNFPFTGACIAFQNGISDNLAAHGGNAFGMMASPASSTVAANDWFILPEITINNGDVFSFWAREITTSYGAEVINVGVYGTSQGTFSSYLAQNVNIASTSWEQYSYDLSAYAGQTIRLAINYVSLDIFGFMFDDIFVGTGNWSDPISVTTGNTYTLQGLDMLTEYEWQVQGVNCDGNGNTTNWSASSYFTTIDGILVTSIEADDVEVVIGGTANITGLVVLPADATNPAVTYTSNNTDIANVNENGVVTGVDVGTTTITIAATDGSGVTATINVTVNGIDVTEITADNVTVATSETATISYTVAPTNATDQSVTFTSANTNIATVDADGVVTGVAVGETTITITSVSNPEVTATITVTVTSNPNAVQFTVNAPANAAPGQTITVEAVLAAPTSGTYDGFNGLVMGIFYDNTAFEYVANSMVYGPVVEQAQQLNSFLTPGTLDGVVQLSIIDWVENSFVTAEGVVFSAQFTVLEGAAGNFSFTAQPYGTDPFSHEGVNILYETTPSTVEVSALQVVEQSVQLVQGWGWWSTCIDAGATFINSLTETIGANATTITGQGENQFLSYSEGYGWMGGLTSIEVEKMYKIEAPEAVQFSVSGPVANPAEHPITLYPGVTWIGYPVNGSQSLGNALGSLTPTANDIIKSSDNYAMYIDGYGWFGYLNTLETGRGYVYQSKASTAKSFTYPSASKGTVKANGSTKEHYWTPVRRFANNMSVMATVSLNGTEARNENVEVGAFVNGECRGTAKLMYVKPMDAYVAFLTVSGANGEPVSFMIHSDGDTYEASERMELTVDGMAGNADSPVVLHANGVSAMTLYPNPVQKGERISMVLPTKADMNGAVIEIANAMGVVVRTQQLRGNVEMLEGLQASGIYTVKVTDKSGNTYYGKLVVR